MDKLDFKHTTLALSLSFLAGYVDTIGFLELGGYFISFMSGNSTRLSVALVNSDWPHIAIIGYIILLFVLGAFTGTLFGYGFTDATRIPYILLIVSLLLAMAAAAYTAGSPLIAIGFMTFAMGAENTIFQRQGDVAIGLTYMTGSLVKIGQRVASIFAGGKKTAWIPYFLLWLSLISGGALGVISYHYLGLSSVWLAAAWGLSLSGIMLWRKR